MSPFDPTQAATATGGSPQRPRLRVATLGGPTTFAGRATTLFAQRRGPQFELSHYLPGMDDLWSELLAGAVDAIVLSADSTGAGPGHTVRRLLGSPNRVHVIDELLVPYHCALFGRPGTQLAGLRTILGHGSLRQCRRFLEGLPGVEVRVLEDKNSAAAAEMVAAGDGTTAVVSTPGAGERFGLVELAADIDDGAAAAWWVIAGRPEPHPTPERVLVAGRLPGDGQLGAAADALRPLGYRLETAFSAPSGIELFTYDYLLAFSGDGTPLADVLAALATFPALALVGALSAPTTVDPATDR